MQLPENIDHIILSFLGIKHRKKCHAVNQNKRVCKNNTTKHRLLCTIHHKMLDRQIMQAPFSSIFQTYKIVYGTNRIKHYNPRRKYNFDQHGFYTKTFV
jgi:hypothetical protein